jgi:hypothetical protein
MSLKNRPPERTDVVGQQSVVSVLTRAVEFFKRHLETWPAKYVDMRVDAISDER